MRDFSSESAQDRCFVSVHYPPPYFLRAYTKEHRILKVMQLCKETLEVTYLNTWPVTAIPDAQLTL